MSVPVVSLLVGGLSGLAFGVVYLGLLWLAVRSLTQDGAGALRFVGLGLVRVVLLVAALAGAAALALPAHGLLAALVGFIAVRTVATRWSAARGGTRWT